MKTSLKAILAMILTATAASPLWADAAGVRAGAYQWQQVFSGDTEAGFDELEFDDDLDYDDDTNNVLWASIEHPLPLLPNVKLQRTSIENEGTTNRTVIYNGRTFAAGSSTDLDLSHEDLTLYYEILDNYVSLDIGLTLRRFDGGFTITDGTQTEEQELDEIVPLVYAGVRFEIPTTDLYLSAEANALGVNDASLADLKASLGYGIIPGLAAEVGYRSIAVSFDDGDQESSVGVSGAYLGLILHIGF